MRKRLIAILLPVALLVTPAVSHAVMTGVGDNDVRMFSSRSYKALHVHIGRLILPYDASQYRNWMAAAAHWLAAAQRAHVEPLVAFYHSEKHTRHIPSTREYTRDIKRFIAKFPSVKNYQPWNEANRGNVRSGSARFNSPSPKQAAAFYEALRAACPKCTVVGLDLLDARNIRPTLRYLSSFKHYVKHMPHLWGLHNYSDTNRFSSSRTRAVLRSVPGQLWLTETGGIVKFGRSFPNRRGSGERRAARALAYMFKLSRLSKRITRLYIYQWFGTSRRARFDAGLVDRRGRPRKGYFVVRKTLTKH